MNGATIGTISIDLDNPMLGGRLRTAIAELGDQAGQAVGEEREVLLFRRDILAEALSCWKAGELPTKKRVLAKPDGFLRQRRWEIIYDEVLRAVAKDLEHGDMTMIFRRAWTETAAWLATGKWPEEMEETTRERNPAAANPANPGFKVL